MMNEELENEVYFVSDEIPARLSWLHMVEEN